jgi:hypothetical protein
VVNRNAPLPAPSGNYRLHRAFAERAGADEGRALLILQRAGDDFRRRGRTAVDQEDNRLTLGQVTQPGVEALRLLGVAAACRDISPLSRKVSATEIA